MSYAQRIPFVDLLKLVRLTTDRSDYPLSEINTYLTDNSNNWSKPQKVDRETEVAITWPYIVDGSKLGMFTTTFKPINLQDGTVSHLGKVTFCFPYKVQYDEYLKNVVTHGTLVNSFSDGGRIYRIYETSFFTWAFIVIPASSKQFFLDGIATEAYTIEVHKKL